MTDTTMTDNPLIKKMHKIIQGTTIRLPSQGRFYKNGELDAEVVNGEIVVYPMTTLDEIIIRTPDMLFQGTAIDKIISRCAPQVKKPLELFHKDVDYILMMLRKLSYGDDVIIKFTCPHCIANADETPVNQHEYKLSINHFIRHSRQIEDDDLKRYRITLGNGMVINMRPSKFNEMIKMHQIDDATKTPEEMEEIITVSILAVINNVDGVDSRQHIQEWLKVLPVDYMKEIIDKIADANNWGPEFSYSIVCKDCNTSNDISYILNPVSFFTLPSSPETSKS